MGSPTSATERYFEQLQRNGKTLEVLCSGSSKAGHDCSDWIVTIHFYILCIYVKALAAHSGQNIQDHVALRAWLNANPERGAMARSYRKAEEASRDARYEGKLFCENEWIRFRRWYVEARDVVVELLKTAGFAPPVIEPVDPEF